MDAVLGKRPASLAITDGVEMDLEEDNESKIVVLVFTYYQSSILLFR